MSVKEYGKTIKTVYKDILRENVEYDKLNICIKKGNDIYFICSHFINCYVLYCFKENRKIPDLDYDFIRMAFKALSKKSCGPLPKGEQLSTLNKLKFFFEKEFVYLITKDKKIEDINDYKFDSTNLSYIFNLFSKEMVTSYTNHVVLNFFMFLNQYVN